MAVTSLDVYSLRQEHISTCLVFGNRMYAGIFLDLRDAGLAP